MLDVCLPGHPGANILDGKTHRMQQAQRIPNGRVECFRAQARGVASPAVFILRIVLQLRAQAADRDGGGILQHRTVRHQITRRGKLVAARRLA